MVVVAGLVAKTAAMAVVVDETRPRDDGGRRRDGKRVVWEETRGCCGWQRCKLGTRKESAMFRVAKAGRRGGQAVSSRRLCGGPWEGGGPAIRTQPRIGRGQAQCQPRSKERAVSVKEDWQRIVTARHAFDCD